MSDPILQFDGVAVEPGPRHDSGIWQVSFALMPGESMILRLEPSALNLPLADAALGLVETRSGRVLFEGVPWNDRSWDDAAAARGTIGRIFGDGGWVRSLDVESNITLAQRHHTHRSTSEIRDEAEAMARRFSLPGLPRGLPTEMSRQDLLRAACVRAFLGKPRLVILEWLTSQGSSGQLLGSLLSAIRSSLRRGAAVLWLTDDANVWSDQGITATHRATMSGSQFVITPTAKARDSQ